METSIRSIILDPVLASLVNETRQFLIDTTLQVVEVEDEISTGAACKTSWFTIRVGTYIHPIHGLSRATISMQLSRIGFFASSVTTSLHNKNFNFNTLEFDMDFPALALSITNFGTPLRKNCFSQGALPTTTKTNSGDYILNKTIVGTFPLWSLWRTDGISPNISAFTTITHRAPPNLMGPIVFSFASFL